MNKASGLLVALEGVFRDRQHHANALLPSQQIYQQLSSKWIKEGKEFCEQGHSYILTQGSSGWSYACSERWNSFTVLNSKYMPTFEFQRAPCPRADPAGDMLELRDAILHPPPLHPSSVFRQSSTSSIIVCLPENKTFHVVSFDVYVLFYFYDFHLFLLFAALVSAHHYTQRIRWTYCFYFSLKFFNKNMQLHHHHATQAADNGPIHRESVCSKGGEANFCHNCSKLSNVFKSWPKLPKVFKSCPKYSKVFQSIQTLSQFAKSIQK